MKPFSEAHLDLSKVLHAIVLGGNVLGAAEGAKKQRRRVPRKQERLIRLVAKHGDVTFERLCDAFLQEWTRIVKRGEGQARLIAKREFFRNIADLVARINAALLAGYQDPQKASEVVDGTGGAYLGFTYDWQTFTVSWRCAPTLTELTEGGRHVPLNRRAREDGREGPPQRLDGDSETEQGGAGPLEITVHEDPVTGVWTFQLRGHQVEVETVHGFVKIDGRLYQDPAVKGLERVAELGGNPLQAIRKLITRYEATALSKPEP